jgi:hypothetical protein
MTRRKLNYIIMKYSISHFFIAIIVSILGLIGFGHSQNLDVMNLPPMTAPVVDYTNTLTASELDVFNTIAVGLES